MNRIEDQANYYKNLHLRDRSITAVIHVEDKIDENFWNVQLQNILPGHYHFVSHSRTADGIDSKGCEQCLKYYPYTNRQFFICIDSDLRLLCGEEGLIPENYIAQTHSYSWESHLCEAEHLQRRFIEKIKDSEFDFISFLSTFSHIVYRPLLFLVHYKAPILNTLWNIGKFNACIPLQPSHNELAENGRLYLEKVSDLFDSHLSSLTLPDDFHIDKLTPENAYLHIQGHRLYNLILHIGTRLCKGKGIAFKSGVLDNKFPSSGYNEIDNVQSDLSIILNG